MSNDCTIKTFQSGSAFLAAASTWLYADEIGNNTILSIAKRAGSPTSLLRPPFMFSMATIDDRVVGCAAFANPDGLVLTEMSRPCCKAIVRNLLSNGLTPARLYAPLEIAPIAVEEISRKTGKELVERTSWRSFGIDHVIALENDQAEKLRIASSDDAGVVQDIGCQYNDEKPSIVDVAEYFSLKVKTADLHLWCEEQGSVVLSVVATAGETEHVTRIAAVFTPRPHRGNGYAGRAVAAATNAKLNDGFRAVTLVVDKEDAAAIRLYERLGYRKLGDHLEMIQSTASI